MRSSEYILFYLYIYISNCYPLQILGGHTAGVQVGGMLAPSAAGLHVQHNGGVEQAVADHDEESRHNVVREGEIVP